MLDLDETILSFALPIFLIKNNESNVSISEDGQYKLNILNKKNKYYLRLNNDIHIGLFEYTKSVSEIFDKGLLERYDKEQEKFFEKKQAQEELLKKLKLKI